jgi:hypothetical protein
MSRISTLTDEELKQATRQAAQEYWKAAIHEMDIAALTELLDEIDKARAAAIARLRAEGDWKDDVPGGGQGAGVLA